MAGVTVQFEDNQPTRSAITDLNGQYWFTTLAIGTDFTILFELSANPQLLPTDQVASTVLLEGSIPAGNPVIILPDLDISLAPGGQSFEPSTPVDGASFSGDHLSPSNPIQFTWTTYNQAQYYSVDLALTASDQIVWSSSEIIYTNVMFGGTLDNGSPISHGTFHWNVAAILQTGAYRLTFHSQPLSLVITP
jgi:hypothetical protein